MTGDSHWIPPGWFVVFLVVAIPLTIFVSYWWQELLNYEYSNPRPRLQRVMLWVCVLASISTVPAVVLVNRYLNPYS